MRGMRLLLCVGIVGLLGCGESAEDQCNDVVNAVCEKFAECSDKEGDDALDLENECLRGLRPVCQKAENELDSVDECVDAINDAKCEDFEAGDGDFEIPELNECSGD